MHILLCSAGGDQSRWLSDIAAALPQAQARIWQAGDTAPADYALVWKPPVEVLLQRPGLKAVFNLGAGVDPLLAMLRQHADLLPPQVPLIKLDDAGMAQQMVQYVGYAVMRHFRRFDDYARQQQQGVWQTLPRRRIEDCRVGVLGLGVLGAQVASSLVQQGFPVRGWSRSAKTLPGVDSYAGPEAMGGFLDGLQVLVNMLPLTDDTRDILDLALFNRLKKGAALINVARGAHLVESDLLDALESGQLAGATLDVFREEPLPAEHPFWFEPRIEITPHISALTVRSDSIAQIVEKIHALERGEAVTGVVDLSRGY